MQRGVDAGSERHLPSKSACMLSKASAFCQALLSALSGTQRVQAAPGPHGFWLRGDFSKLKVKVCAQQATPCSECPGAEACSGLPPGRHPRPCAWSDVTSAQTWVWTCSLNEGAGIFVVNLTQIELPLCVQSHYLGASPALLFILNGVCGGGQLPCVCKDPAVKRSQLCRPGGVCRCYSASPSQTESSCLSCRECHVPIKLYFQKRSRGPDQAVAS